MGVTTSKQTQFFFGVGVGDKQLAVTAGNDEVDTLYIGTIALLIYLRTNRINSFNSVLRKDLSADRKYIIFGKRIYISSFVIIC